MYTSLQHSSQMEVVQPIIAQLLMSSQLHPYTYTQKLLTNLMPTDDERAMIAERRAAKPDIPLGPAEEFLYTLASIPELHARLSLWRFNYVFQQVEEVRIGEGGGRGEWEGGREGEGGSGREGEGRGSGREGGGRGEWEG